MIVLCTKPLSQGGWKCGPGTKLHARVLREKDAQKKPNMFNVGNSTSVTLVLLIVLLTPLTNRMHIQLHRKEVITCSFSLYKLCMRLWVLLKTKHWPDMAKTSNIIKHNYMYIHVTHMIGT